LEDVINLPFKPLNAILSFPPLFKTPSVYVEKEREEKKKRKET